MSASDELLRIKNENEPGVSLDSPAKETNNIDNVDDGSASLNGGKTSFSDIYYENPKKHEDQKDTETNKIKGQENFESRNDEKTPEEECLIQIQQSQQTSWVPDGGWGWMVVVGGIIIHVFIGTRQ